MTSLRAIAWRYPQWWIATSSLFAWAWLISSRVFPSRHHGHARGFALFDWIVMVMAMMLPLVFHHIRFTATRSLWPRRQRAVFAFLFGYTGSWFLIGPAVSTLATFAGVTRFIHSPWTAVAGFAAASLWQLAPQKRRALALCHGTVPLSPRGWRADRDCVQYGSLVGWRCITSCGALMLACVLAHHSLLAMMSATAVAGAERLSIDANGRTTSAALGLLALAHATLQV
jgi:predicted metal-binding membrane protein